MTTAPVEGKVNAQGYGNVVGMALSGLIAWALGVIVWGQPSDAAHAMLAAAAVPPPVLTVLALLPVGLGYACGYMAKHTPRPADLTGAPVIVKTDATTVPIVSAAIKAALDDLRAALARPVTVKLDGKTIASVPMVASGTSIAASDDPAPQPPADPTGPPEPVDPDPAGDPQPSSPYMGGA